MTVLSPESPQPRGRRETSGATSERRNLVAQLGAFLGIATAVLTSLHQSCQANRKADLGVEVGVQAQEKADGVFLVTKEKADATGTTVEEIADKAVTRKELEELVTKIERATGKKIGEVEAKPIEVPKEVSKELPANAAAAAATVQTKESL